MELHQQASKPARSPLLLSNNFRAQHHLIGHGGSCRGKALKLCRLCAAQRCFNSLGYLTGRDEWLCAGARRLLAPELAGLPFPCVPPRHWFQGSSAALPPCRGTPASETRHESRTQAKNLCQAWAEAPLQSWHSSGGSKQEREEQGLGNSPAERRDTVEPRSRIMAVGKKSWEGKRR